MGYQHGVTDDWGASCPPGTLERRTRPRAVRYRMLGSRGSRTLSVVHGAETQEWPPELPSGTAKAAVRVISGIAHFRGAIRTSCTNPVPFVLPTALRPHHTVYVTVSLCKGINGRLEIVPNGSVVVEPENNDFAQAKCLASLDGVSFVR